MEAVLRIFGKKVWLATAKRLMTEVVEMLARSNAYQLARWQVRTASWSSECLPGADLPGRCLPRRSTFAAWQPVHWNSLVASANPNDGVEVVREETRRSELAARQAAKAGFGKPAVAAAAPESAAGGGVVVRLSVQRLILFGDEAILPRFLWDIYRDQAATLWPGCHAAGDVGMAVVEAPYTLSYLKKDGSGAGSPVTLTLNKRAVTPRFDSCGLVAVPAEWPVTTAELRAWRSKMRTVLECAWTIGDVTAYYYADLVAVLGNPCEATPRWVTCACAALVPLSHMRGVAPWLMPAPRR
jgi:hypothetical protein